MSSELSAGEASGSRIEVRSLTKRYGSVTALDGVELDIRAGEFLALLGPSGSGKTTLLMTLAGFETPDSGAILVDGADVVRVPPHKRNLGMMFQRYALFPNLDVRRNVEYPLRARGMKPTERARLVAEALRLVSLEDFASRRISELSGGQQQRVALARAIVFSPSLLLMDEPLGALDRKLRERVQLELRALHRRLGATIVFVTHDQGEAMTMADRIAVMDHATVSQIGTPQELYERPANRFVAAFLGKMNFFEASVIARTDRDMTLAVDGATLVLSADRVVTDGSGSATLGDTVHLALRPHDTAIVAPADPAATITAAVTEVVYDGPRSTVIVQTGRGELTCEIATSDLGGVTVGDSVGLTLAPEHGLVYLD